MWVGREQAGSRPALGWMAEVESTGLKDFVTETLTVRMVSRSRTQTGWMDQSDDPEVTQHGSCRRHRPRYDEQRRRRPRGWRTHRNPQRGRGPPQAVRGGLRQV